MSEKRVIRRKERLYCPHCKVFIGETENSFFRAGFIRLISKVHPIECVKCGGASIFFNDENCRENSRESLPVLTHTKDQEPDQSPDFTA